jgi:hypothetical protein
MRHRDEWRAAMMYEIKKILERPNSNSAYQDAREIWFFVILPMLDIEKDYWLEKFATKSVDRH